MQVNNVNYRNKKLFNIYQLLSRWKNSHVFNVSQLSKNTSIQNRQFIAAKITEMQVRVRF